MKNYYILKTISIVCFILTGVCAMISAICILEYKAAPEAILTAFMTIVAFVLGVIYTKNATEAFKDYINIRSSLRKSYDQLSTLYIKNYWALDIDSLIPVFTNKKQLLVWCADTAIACQVYQGDYKTEAYMPTAHQELSQMISLAKEIINHKQYL